ncbi:hypothetical protein [Streptomyces sp. NPDC059850]|uniref:hypothetical protein n=1 Tax=Streptomyces sp. NPDC059850 TaxID=3346970 RepID=UPI003654F340
MFNPGTEGAELLGILAWCVTAAAVAGLMIVGLQLALQLRRGEMGEGATYFRGGVIVMAACTIGATARPIFVFVVEPFLLR